MRYIDLLARDHPDMDPARAVLENCPSDFGYLDRFPLFCFGEPIEANEITCRRCWEREVQG